MNTQKLQFLSNEAATSGALPWRGGPGTFLAKATGFGTVKLQVLLPDQTTWFDVGADTTLTADGGGNFDLPPCQLRANVATATAVYAVAVSRQ
jgi:hypothetical protein